MAVTPEMIEAALVKAEEYGLNLRDKHGNEHMRAMLAAAQATEHPLAKMVRDDEEMGLYDDEQVPLSPAMSTVSQPVTDEMIQAGVTALLYEQGNNPNATPEEIVWAILNDAGAVSQQPPITEDELRNIIFSYTGCSEGLAEQAATAIAYRLEALSGDEGLRSALERIIELDQHTGERGDIEFDLDGPFAQIAREALSTSLIGGGE